MINQIKQLIKEIDGISDWSISKNIIKRVEEYFIADTRESLREVNEERYTVIVYVDKMLNDNKMRGMAYQTFSSNTSLAKVESLIKDAVFAASLALNPYYPLADKAENDECYDTCDQSVFDNPKAAIKEVSKQLITSLANEEQVKLASAEIFITCRENTFVTSKGLTSNNKSTNIMLEAVMLSGSGENEVESSFIRNERFLDLLNTCELVKEYAEHARNSLIAVLPESGKFDVIFTGEALNSFFDYYAFQASGYAAYNKAGKFSLNDHIAKDVKGDKLTIISDPSLKGGLATGKYDSYGLLLEKFPIIQDGKIVNIAANIQYATYLNIKPLGSISNIHVPAGNHSFEELKSQNTFVLSRFSTFSPSGITGAFSGEIRSGYQVKDGKKLQIKGGSVTGMMDKAMTEVYFSSEMIQKGSYYGPKYIKVCNVDIAGS